MIDPRGRNRETEWIREGVKQAMTWHGTVAGSAIIERFEYPVCSDAPSEPGWNGWIEAGEDNVAVPPAATDRSDEPAPDPIFEERLAEATRRSFEVGRERGREEGRRAERETAAPAAAAEEERHRRQAAELVENFAGERDRYLQTVEQEVVRLALAVAARILRREAQMDPLLLTGAVRVALGQLAATSEIRLRVPAKEAELWKETIALLPRLAVKPLVVAEESMLLGDCAIESKVGSVDLGIRTQLGEIERGFFDRMGNREATSSPAAENSGQADSPVEALP
jgi:flagellar assembly protein FliH